MNIHSNLSSFSDPDTCGLYVHLQPANSLQNLTPVINWLKTEFKAHPVLHTSFFIPPEQLYEKDNLNSFMADFWDRFDFQYPGLQVALCPTDTFYAFSVEPPNQ